MTRNRNRPERREAAIFLGRANAAPRCGPAVTGVLTACAVLLGSAAAAWSQSLPDGAAGRVRQMAATAPAALEVGVCVVDADRGDVLVESGADAPLKPASTLKLLVSAAALDRFGPDFTFDTELYTAGDELWLRGGGDPGLGDDRLARRAGRTCMSVLEEWSEALRTRGVTELRTLVVDDGVFDRQYRHPDWPDEQAQRWYAAPVGGLNLNDNCLDVRIVLAGGRPALRVTPPLPPSMLSDELRAGRRHRPAARRDAGSDVFRVVGTAARGDELGPVSANDPTIFTAFALKAALEQRGITISGEVVRRRLAPEALAGATLIARHRTPLRDVIWRANNFSQNLFAECAMKALAAYEPDGRRAATPGTWGGGTEVLIGTLGRLGVSLEGAVIRDGSGLSHANRVTARQLATLLAAMRRHAHAGVFAESLATPGRDGTLRKRFVAAPGPQRLRLKTGTLRDASSLAGYVERPGGRALAVAVIACGPEEAARRFADAVVLALLTDGPASP